MKTKQNFTEGPILPTLTKFAMPVLLAILLQDMYGGRPADGRQIR